MSERTNDAGFHTNETDDGTQQTTIYIQELVPRGETPANSEVLVLSCYISEKAIL